MAFFRRVSHARVAAALRFRAALLGRPTLGEVPAFFVDLVPTRFAVFFFAVAILWPPLGKVLNTGYA